MQKWRIMYLCRVCKGNMWRGSGGGFSKTRVRAGGSQTVERAGDNNTGCDLVRRDWSFGPLVWHCTQWWRSYATDTSRMTGHRCRITAIRGDSWRMRKRRQKKTEQMSQGFIWIAIMYICLICSFGQAHFYVFFNKLPCHSFFFFLAQSEKKRLNVFSVKYKTKN